MSQGQQTKQCHILHSSQKTELTTKNLLLQYKKFIISRIQESLSAKHALCMESVFFKKTHVVSVNTGLSKLPPDTPARHSLSQLSPWKLSPATASYILAAFMTR